VSWLADPVGYPISGPAVNASSIAALSRSSVIGGGQIGCNWQTASIVWGIEGDFDGTNLKADRIVSNTVGGTFTNEQSFKTTWLSTVRGRFGFLVTPNWLLFATGGAAFANVKYSDCELHGIATTFCDTTGASGSFNLANYSATKAGYAVGGGAEVLFGAWSLKAEYLFIGLGSVTTVSQISPFVANDDITHFHKNLNIQTVRFGVNYHFNWGGPVVAGY
jgi:outer membrane immunogenic protein